MKTHKRKLAGRRDQDLPGWAWTILATTYPHEAYATWPDRFLRYARKKTGRTDEQIIAALRDTAGA